MDGRGDEHRQGPQVDGVRLREFAESDIDWWVGLRRRIDDSIGEDALRNIAGGTAVPFVRRTVAEVDGVPVGCATVARPRDQEHPGMLVAVDPAFQGRGIGSRLRADCWPSVADEKVVTGFLVDHDPRALAVVQHWGFEVVSHGILSRLQPLPDTWPALPDGTALLVVDDEVGATPEQDELLTRLMDEADTSPERLELGWSTTPTTLRGFFSDMVWVVAVVDGVPAALSSCSPGDDGEWIVVFSGTRPDHRRRGLSRLVKHAMHAEAARRGARSVSTMNEERNTAVRALNASLGYEVTGGEYRVRHVRAGT